MDRIKLNVKSEIAYRYVEQQEIMDPVLVVWRRFPGLKRFPGLRRFPGLKRFSGLKRSLCLNLTRTDESLLNLR